MEEKEYLQQLHKTLQEMLDYIVNICNENDLIYFLEFGTALGAYRHKGFIPWDDDLDITMPRPDYNKFIDIMRSSDNPDYSIQDRNNEENYFLSFVKVRKNNTLFREEIVDGLYKNNGIFIDIFPLDCVNADKLNEYKKNLKKTTAIARALRFFACNPYYEKYNSKAKFKMLSIMNKPYKNRSWQDLLEEMDRLSMENGDWDCYAYIISDEMRRLLKKEDYYPAKLMEFEGKEYRVPGNMEAYLKVQYGPDFMTLPPKEEQRTHMPLEVKF